MTSNQKVIVAAVAAATFLPIFRSGLQDGLNFWQWFLNHTVWGPPVEYIPEEDYTVLSARISAMNRREI